MTRLKKVIPLILITFAILLIGELLRTKIIIYFGITAYNIIHAIPIILWLVVLSYVIYAIICNIADKKHQKIHNTDQVYKETPMTEIQTNDDIRSEFMKTFVLKWQKHLSYNYDLIKQFDEFNVYQDNITDLLKQTDDLGDRPVELMQKLEDTMYLNTRVLLNYMRVLQERDTAIVQEKLKTCYEKNAILLDKGSELCIGLTDYVNNDLTKEGEKQRILDKINSYMFVTLDAIEAPEIRLA